MNKASKITYKILPILATIILYLLTCGCIFIDKPTSYQELCVLAQDESKFEHMMVETNDVSYQDSSNYQYISYSDLEDKHLNFIINFVNYINDDAHKLTKQEIHDTLDSLENGVSEYFSRVSRNSLPISFDYIVSCSSKSYNDLLKKSSSDYSFERQTFENALHICADENGIVKKLAFSDYQVKINLFAGSSGEWNTFLWPHAYTDSGLILLMENRSNVGTLCHETLHIVSLEDLYVYSGDSQTFGVGSLDIMGSSDAYNNLNAYYRSKVNWLSTSCYDDDITSDIEIIKDEDIHGQDLKLVPSFYQGEETKTIAYEFGFNESLDQFFVVEYRIRNYDEKYDSGLYGSRVIVIYRVNRNVEGNADGNEANGNAEIIFMGDLSQDISTYSYIRSCQLSSGSYGTYEKSNHSFLYSSGQGKENLFSGDNFPYRLNIKSLDENEATIALEKYYAITPTSLGNGHLSIDSITGCAEGDDLKIFFIPDTDNTVTSIKIDGEAIAENEVRELASTGYYTFNKVDANHTIEVEFGKVIYNINYELDGGKFLTPFADTYIFGQEYKLPIPSKENYTFIGWSQLPNSQSYVEKIPSISYGDVTLYANWLKSVFEIKAETEGAGRLSFDNKINIKRGEDFLFEIIAGENKYLNELIIDDEKVSLDELIKINKEGSYSLKNITSDHTIKAKFGDLKFNLSYEANEGSGDLNITSYYYKKENVLPTLTRPGYDFLGWSFKDSNVHFKSVPIDTYGDVTLYANWHLIDYEVEGDMLVYRAQDNSFNIAPYLEVAHLKEQDVCIILPNSLIFTIDKSNLSNINYFEPIILSSTLEVYKHGLMHKEYNLYINIDKEQPKFLRSNLQVKISPFLAIDEINWWTGANWQELEFYSERFGNLIIVPGVGNYNFVLYGIKFQLLVITVSVLLIALFIVLYVLSNKKKKNK